MKTKTGLPKTLADVGKATNCDLEAVAAAIRQLPVPEDEQQYMVDTFNWTKIAQALNEGVILTFTDGKTKSWPYAWIVEDKKDPSGVGFSRTFTAWTSTRTHVGARHLFVDDATALYAINQFEDTFKGAFVKNREVKL